MPKGSLAIRLVVAGIPIWASLLACSSGRTIRMYEGAEQKPSQLARLHPDTNSYIRAIDGASVYETAPTGMKVGNAVDVSPGRHTIQLAAVALDRRVDWAAIAAGSSIMLLSEGKIVSARNSKGVVIDSFVVSHVTTLAAGHQYHFRTLNGSPGADILDLAAAAQILSCFEHVSTIHVQINRSDTEQRERIPAQYELRSLYLVDATALEEIRESMKKQAELERAKHG